MAVVHDELLRQIEEAGKIGSTVEVVFSILDPGSASFPSPEQTEALVHELIKRVTDKAHEGPEDYNIFRNLGTFVIDASPRFVRLMIEQKEIFSVIPNRS